MRIASWSWGGRPHAGLISPDGTEATPLAGSANCADHNGPSLRWPASSSLYSWLPAAGIWGTGGFTSRC